ncbi:MAG: glucose-1-phosphate adenylyltransferase subunit GlgD [Dehalococcoidia bacterium]|nr:glucose-1-phosphate adenylyltransferase subunit GlgD [Dehalococcoidia bacterium]MDD5493385.1 glucose-1-phosphate adenylyltransferase subunit GlgD [Dehalococcoidia bacterium]
MKRVLAVILAGGASERLSILAAERAKPAVPFGGKYRIIDFTLSNCANSGIYNVAVLTQFNPRSLAQHIGVGRPWDMDKAQGGVVILQPFLSRSARDWYKGTADAVYQNIYYIIDQRVDEILVLSADHIYNMRYDQLLTAHRNRHADVTVAVYEVDQDETSRFGIITVDHNERIVNFEEKPKVAKSRLASMGIYVFNKSVLVEALEEMARKQEGFDFGHNVLPELIGKYQVYGYRFRGYWRDVGTIETYWQTNMDLIVDLPDLNLYNPDNEVRTVFQGYPPVKLGPKAQISRALVCNGAIINGTLINSIISPRVFIEEDAVVRNSIIFEDTTIGRGSSIDKSIIDKQVWISRGCRIGEGDDYTPNQEEPEYLKSGITLVGKGARIPSDVTIGRNCKIEPWVEASDFLSKTIVSGEVVKSKIPRRYQI